MRVHVCANHVTVLVGATKLAESTSQYYFVLQSFLWDCVSGSFGQAYADLRSNQMQTIFFHDNGG